MTDPRWLVLIVGSAALVWAGSTSLLGPVAALALVAVLVHLLLNPRPHPAGSTA